MPWDVYIYCPAYTSDQHVIMFRRDGVAVTVRMAWRGSYNREAIVCIGDGDGKKWKKLEKADTAWLYNVVNEKIALQKAIADRQNKEARAATKLASAAYEALDFDPRMAYNSPVKLQAYWKPGTEETEVVFAVTIEARGVMASQLKDALTLLGVKPRTRVQEERETRERQVKWEAERLEQEANQKAIADAAAAQDAVRFEQAVAAGAEI
jgi:hypothetical protein